ncbi:Queuosine biosynthesis protein [Sulfurimonas denitrificans DSM 1251]|jgi:S-adenosylmethionine:tRNA ribosyltransferase-isomerase|uniref:S-adenosylmethionine:tRNA ribosyltransferase-isomerase n=1 Tax=Sulfurimonas denitrificans (strain ATCC 33889 / DSM 1251) TaxID=326298 RepID=QUEA_SULDN|nr:tRNA preQ1(34) S-adenosylmethionine ribosyltransferase-isomerase QueA [Sulfurimonas denitrificans]Q30PZ7.1 RecName: Full=S-adenosylmethionine:tRNA ribosyltransferase-isomerase; AltName: Full=Queuosine biosynthesis protein QueA [Sulfurimonas denitrificans DSM 1251]ABB44934.1 Queuosine biosynthesis protein [Sulfurimonas denitrificans DSM 1251]MDD3442664.1 tRNA preQ1(34) S-adenosylmethionine ribosyltransferase-isomerase QueA [Sulfurimonas denitrificans]
MSSSELLTSSYDFTLPEELIATQPANPRDSAKLLVYDRASDEISHVHFYDFEKFIPKNCALIFNDTKVIKARLFGQKESGGKIELLINRALDAHNIHVFTRGKVKIGTKISFGLELFAKIIELLEDGSRVVNFYKNDSILRFEEILPIIDKIGHIPLPPYIQREDNKDDEIEYQSVFAKEEGAVAAPTASLHFTKEQHERVCTKFTHAYITLHVGSGTFKPVECEKILEHTMHSEYYDISDRAKELLDSKVSILSVGTTSTRTIEFYARNKEHQRGEANLFLHPKNKPLRVDHILTNFHLPKSTLLMLVASFVGVDKAQELYKIAIEKEYRFYSYGDAMLIL